MKRLIVIVEGDTEKEFVDRTLAPYLNGHGVYSISCYKITKTRGGLTHYQNLKTDLLKATNEENVFVTTLVDFYALPTDFPRFQEANKIADKNLRVSLLENAILEDIQGEKYFPHLFPYIQLHEFEAFVFTSMEGIRNYFSEKEADYANLDKVILSFSNPEDINDNKETAPSKRLKKAIPSYNKLTDGNSIVDANGIDSILEKCPRFRWWVASIIEKLKFGK